MLLPPTGHHVKPRHLSAAGCVCRSLPTALKWSDFNERTHSGLCCLLLWLVFLFFCFCFFTPVFEGTEVTPATSPHPQAVILKHLDMQNAVLPLPPRLPACLPVAFRLDQLHLSLIWTIPTIHQKRQLVSLALA